MTNNHLPNLIIPGAPRAGTSSIVEYLNHHPDIFFPKIKEPRFFIGDIIKQVPKTDPLYKFLNTYSITSYEEYLKLYEKSNASIKGDASVQYMYYHDFAIPKIKQSLNDPKILIVLRNPVQRAYSNYTFMRYKGKKSFEHELRNEDKKRENNWNSFVLFADQGFYYEQVKSYMDSFSQVKIILFEDMKANTSNLFTEIFDFLEIDNINIKKISVNNQSGVPKNNFFKWLIFNDNFIKTYAKKIMSTFLDSASNKRIILKLKNSSLKKGNEEYKEETFTYLEELYKTDILKLQDLIDRDLSAWLK